MDLAVPGCSMNSYSALHLACMKAGKSDDNTDDDPIIQKQPIAAANPQLPAPANQQMLLISKISKTPKTWIIN